MRAKTISLPCLDALTPTLESTALKLMEEAGELAQAIGKYRGMSGEPGLPEEKRVVQRIVEELVDVAQTAVTMMYVLEKEYDVDIEQTLRGHLEKMVRKGYLRNGSGQPDRLITDTDSMQSKADKNLDRAARLLVKFSISHFTLPTHSKHEPGQRPEPAQAFGILGKTVGPFQVEAPDPWGCASDPAADGVEGAAHAHHQAHRQAFLVRGKEAVLGREAHGHK